jgi:hypothetical protein
VEFHFIPSLQSIESGVSRSAFQTARRAIGQIKSKLGSTIIVGSTVDYGSINLQEIQTSLKSIPLCGTPCVQRMDVRSQVGGLCYLRQSSTRYLSSIHGLATLRKTWEIFPASPNTHAY